MKEHPGQPTEKGLAWQRELFGYLDDLTSRRLAERQAVGKASTAEPPASYGAPLESTHAAVEEAADVARAPRVVVGDLAANEVAPPPVSSGIDELDACLGGGFFPGLWTIVGQPGTDTPAFLESVAWETVAHHQAVVYYALGQGVEPVRKRLRDVLGIIAGGEADDSSEVGPDWCSDSEQRAGLDPAARLMVLSRLWIVDSLPGGADPIGAFLRGLERTLGEVASHVGRVPLVLIDDLESLLHVLGVESTTVAARVITGLNGTLSRCASAGLLAARSEPTGLARPAGEPAVDVLARLSHGRLELLSRSPVRVDLTIHENPHAAWRGTLPLVLHPSVGMVTLAE